MTTASSTGPSGASQPSNTVDSDSVEYGVIGTGMMGVEHIYNINAIDGAEVVVLSDPVQSSLAAGIEAAAAGQAVHQSGPGHNLRGYADHRALLERPGLDAVVIASPNFTHVDVLADVLASGKHVLIEKPLCTTVADCQQVIELEAQTRSKFPDRIVQVGLEYRYMPAVAKLVSEVAAGVVGTPRMVAIREHRFPFLEKVGHWNRLSSNTGGTLVEKCCHFFDLMNLIIGERPTRVLASGAQDVNHLDEIVDGQQSDILDNAYVIVDYPSGARAMLDLCMFAEATYNQEEISVVGEKGKAEALIPEGVFRLGLRGTHYIGDVTESPVSDDHIPYEGLHHGSSYVEHLHFLKAIKGEEPVPVTLEDGLWSVAIGQAAHLSIDEGRPVEMSELLDQSTNPSGSIG
ncbi:MAG: Gfo/Idh/MocA family protein [Acidimicrobiales bacterium]